MKRERENKPTPATSKSSGRPSDGQRPPATGLDLQLRRTLGPIRPQLDEAALALLKQLASLPIGSATQQAYVWLWLAAIYQGIGLHAGGSVAKDTAHTIGNIQRIEAPPTKVERPVPRKSDALDEEAVEALYRMHFPDLDPNALDILDKALALPVRVPVLQRHLVEPRKYNRDDDSDDVDAES